MATDFVTGAEAQQLLAALRRARETGRAADVWGPFDRLEALAQTVIAHEAEVAELRAKLDAVPRLLPPSSGPDVLDRADLVTSLAEDVARLHDTLQAVARACTLPEDTLPAALPGAVEACIRDLSGQIQAPSRSTPPTPAEVEALAGEIGLSSTWLASCGYPLVVEAWVNDEEWVEVSAGGWSGSITEAVAHFGITAWSPLRQGRVCAWPVVTGETRKEGSDNEFEHV